MIYGVESAKDLTEIIVNPASMHNSNEGRKIQEEIGTRVLRDQEQIEATTQDEELLAQVGCPAYSVCPHPVPTIGRQRSGGIYGEREIILDKGF